MYIVLEGIDGSGKDTQAELLLQRLTEEGGDPVLVAEPDKAMPGGVELRSLLKSGNHVKAHAGLFLANRTALQTHVVCPALVRGGTVVSIRSFVSTLVYQQENWPLDWLFAIHSKMPTKPHLIVILDLPSEVGLERATKRPGHNEHYEKLETLERVRQRYLRLARPDRLTTGPKLWDFIRPAGRIEVIDAQGSVETVAAAVWKAYQRTLSEITFLASS